LDKAHRAGIVHRDLKPLNVMLTKSGPKLLDFGLAKLHGKASPVAFSDETGATTAELGTAKGTILGTIHYMSPEQLEGRDADTRSDIWALGALLYEMATGQRPFDGESAASVIGAILKDTPPAIAARQPLTPPMLERIVQKCLAKAPDDRWQNARDLRTALEWSTETGPLGAPPAPRRSSRVGVVLAMAAAFAVGGGIVWTSRVPVDPPRRVSLRIAPPAGAEFVVSAIGGGAAISPDGRTITFVARKDGVTSLWLRSLDGDEARQLADTDDAAQPFWSPDSRSIGYFAGGNLRRIDIAGGASHSVTTATQLPRGGAWLADGTIVFSPGVGPLRAVAATGGASTPFTVPREGEPSHRWPRVLPDGRTLLYFIQGRQPGIYLVTDGKAANPRRIEDAALDAAYAAPLRGLPGVLLTVANDRLVARTFDPASTGPPGSPVAIPGVGDVRTFAGPNRSNLSVANDGTILYVPGSGRNQLAWFRGDGSLIGKAAVAPDRYVSIQLSATGDRVLAVVEAGAGVRDAWVLDLAVGTRNRITSENRAGYATWSPDAQHVAIAAPGLQQMIEKAPMLGAAERTVLAGEDLFPGSWSSRDGRIVYVARRPATGYDIWAVATDGSGKPAPLLQSAATEIHPQMSPDGRMLAFTSDESGRRAVYVRDYPDGHLVQRVSTSGGSYPRWGPRSDEVFYRSEDGRLVVVPLKYSGHAMTAGESRSLMPLIEPPGELIYPYDIASDGRILALTPLEGASSSVSLGVLMNWRPEVSTK
ncbi:MAG: protein kinase, partial [Vicinamibacterales bacterium]